MNFVQGNLKAATKGTYHGFKFRKYAPRYLAALQCPFNCRVICGHITQIGEDRRYDTSSAAPRLRLAELPVYSRTNITKKR